MMSSIANGKPESNAIECFLILQIQIATPFQIIRRLNEKRRTSNNKCLDRINYILYPILDSSSKTYMKVDIGIPIKDDNITGLIEGNTLYVRTQKIKVGDTMLEISIRIKKGDTESITLSTSPE